MLALHNAVMKNDYKLVKESVELLLQNEKCINIVNGEGYTPLHLASENGYKDIIVYLIEKGANINTSILDNVETPLPLAIKNGHIDVVKLLIERGADVNQILPKGDTPLHSAVKARNLNILKILLQEGAEINLKDVAHGYSPLHLAVIHYSLGTVSINDFKQNSSLNILDIIEYLIKKGADINAKNWDEETPLHSAARHNEIILMKLLVKLGADINLESSDGHTSIDLLTDDTCLYEFIKCVAFYNQTPKSDNKYHYEFWKCCKKELKIMKDSVIDNSNLSWYTFLTENDSNCLEAYFRNDSIRQQLEIEDFKIDFPLYKSLIETQIIRGKKRYLLTRDIIQYFYSDLLVEDCWRKILSYLNTSDLENFVNIFRKIK